MKYETIADIYSANEKAREYLTATVSSISDEEAVALPEGEKWTIQKIVEHLSMVDFGISRICAKLIGEAKSTGKFSDGTVNLSPDFLEKLNGIGSVKVEAPERVQPTGTISITEALVRMHSNRPAIEAMRSDLEKYDLNESKFPHPYFGNITAAEWLIVAGGHELRHTAQIERSLAKLRK
ncbi:MAG: DinB family protein [Chloracidobacterium sp.]|nr:DinB family protein [Chloracidobacterium sp.]